MAEMNTQQIINYLKQVSNLETSVYKQTEVKKHIREQLVEPTLKDTAKPKRAALSHPCKPDLWDIGTAGLTGLLFAVIAVILLIVALCGEKGAAFIIASVILLWFGVCLFLPGFARTKREYAEASARYQKACEENQKKYDLALQNYENESKQANEQFAAAQKAYHTAVKEIAKLDAPIEKSQSLLTQLYDTDIIFPKYRNMVAMCTMYEYFASGRCTELAGPTGAYNLYEAELRQNLIINQLEQVNENLEQVKQNQYILYQGIKETNQALHDISATLYDVALSSKITAYCSQITAINAQAQTYLAVMD